MLKQDSIVTLPFTTDELKQQKVFEYTEAACIGGKSQMRKSSDRSEKLFEDNLVGQVCNYAASLYLTGNSEAYHYARKKANANPYAGDGGSDIPGCEVDIKGSLMRGGPDPLSYRLIVRPAERYDNWYYLLVLTSGRKDVDGYIVHIVGGATTNMLPEKVEKGGVFDGAYILPAISLQSIKNCNEVLKNWKRKVQND